MDAAGAGSAGDARAVAQLDTQIGMLTVVAGPSGVLSLGWGAGTLGHDRGDAAGIVAATDVLDEAIGQLGEYFSGERTRFSVPLCWSGVPATARSVLTTLDAQVPYGSTVTYGELARLSGTTVPARGIGAVMGANPFPILVACHRVVASDGLGGYSGGLRPDDDAAGGSSRYGLETKRWLLTFEGAWPPVLGWDPAARLDLDDMRHGIRLP